MPEAADSALAHTSAQVTDQNRERPLGYGGPTQFLNAQAEKLNERDADGNYTTECIKIKKIFVVAVMVDLIEDWFPESIESPDSILDSNRTLAMTVNS